MTEKTLTDEQAEELLLLLSNHFGEPVKPVSRYCNSFREWEAAYMDRANRLLEKAFPGLGSNYDSEKYKAAAKKKNEEFNKIRAHNPDVSWTASEAYAAEEFFLALQNVDLQISKSDLLYRLIYCDESIRKEMCPEHEGRWCGLEFNGNKCKHGCQLTGWLPEENDKTKPAKIASVEIFYEVDFED